MHKETDAADALYTLVAAFCAPDADATAQARELAATRKRWSKRLHMTEADWADAAAWAVTHHSDRNPSIYPPEKTAWSKYGPIDQWAGVLRLTMGDSSQTSDPAYVADAFGAELTEAGRLGYIMVCIQGERPAEWAMCADDIARFDAAKLFNRAARRHQAHGEGADHRPPRGLPDGVEASGAPGAGQGAPGQGSRVRAALLPGRGDAQRVGRALEERRRAPGRDGVDG